MTIKLELTSDDIEIIGQALDERPYKIVASLVNRLQTQINEQLASGEPKQQKEVS